MTYAVYAGTIVGTYFIGAIPFGFVIAKLVKGVDIREHGSKNIGGTNVGRVCGWGWFPVVIALDAAKGFFPVFFAAPFIAERFPCPH